MVQVLKKGLKLASRLSVDHQLANLLLSYQSTPHSTTGVPPAELFLKRQLRTRLTLLKPDQEAAVRRKQAQQKQQHDQNSKQVRTFQPDHVAVLQFRGSKKWVPGIVVQALGPVAYMVNVNNRIIHVHVDHFVAAPPCAPLPDTQVTNAHPNSPSRPTSLIPEVRNPAHSQNPDSPEILVSPVPVKKGIHYISSIQSSCQPPGENIRHNSGSKPTAQPSRDGWCSTINKDPETTCKT